MIEKILRVLFPNTIRIIELRTKLDSQNQMAEGIIRDSNAVIYELPNKRYRIGVIEETDMPHA